MFTKKRIIGVLSAAMLVAAVIAAPAYADLTVNAGTLDFDPAGAPAIGNFTAVTLNGVPQLTSLTIAPFTLVDATGSDLGWNVLLTIPDLVNGADTILASNVSMTAPLVTGAAGSSMVGVTANASAGGFNAGEKIAVATATNGNGTYLISPKILKLTVPVTALVGLYVSAGTIAIVSGP